MNHQPQPRSSPRAHVVEGREGIAMFHLLQLRGALSLETRGMKHSQGSVYAYVKRLFNLRGNKQQVLDQLDEIIDKVREGELVYFVGEGVKTKDEDK